ncbi:MAG: peptidoglycan -binding protein [Alphaproteobacteria bacterium]|nr:MAG: peptidoglycan -binding protein [Alphaproteobacteria bacterium]
MPRASRRRGDVEFWPGFVDALATLLIVIIFLVLVFVLAQFFLTQAITRKDETLDRLTAQISQLGDLLALERQSVADLRLQLGETQAEVSQARQQREAQNRQIALLTLERDGLATRLGEAERRGGDLQSRLDLALRAQDSAERQLADAARATDADQARIRALLAEREQVQRDIAALRTVRADLEREVAKLAGDVRARDASLAERDQRLAERDQRLTEAAQARADLEQRLASQAGTLDATTRDLGAVRDRAAALEARLATEVERTLLAQRQIAEREVRLEELLAASGALTRDLTAAQRLSEAQRDEIALLARQLDEVRAQLVRLNAALEQAEAEARDKGVQIINLGQRLNAALAGRVEELARYRSEFFGRLRQLLGDRDDVRVVGDRFVFQSEVLFPTGSAELRGEGREQVLRLAATIRELIDVMPTDLPWILRVDGHTDRAPIRSGQFRSNWELSAARAITVVRTLIEQGIPPDRVAAAGFGEFQPLGPDDDPDARARNRRIELKLTER